MLTVDSLSSRNEEEGNVRFSTPESSDAISQSSPGIPRELYVDVTCAEVVRALLGGSSIKLVPVDLAALLARNAAASLDSATAIVIAPVLRHGVTAIEVVEQLRGLIPQIGIYVVARSTAEIALTLPRLAAVGVDEVFCLDSQSDAQELRDTMKLRLAAPAPETEIRLLWKWFRESPERSLVMHCVRKTLQNRVTVVGLPSPGILSRCGRVLHAQELERRGVKPTSLVADILGFPSAGAMQRSRRRLRKALMSRGRQALVFASLLK
jgi:hypothetical protein